MLTALIPRGIDPNSILAEDNSGTVLRYGDLPQLAAKWRERLPGRRLVVLLCANTVPHIATYFGLHAAGHATILLPASTAPNSLSDIVAIYQADAIVRASGSGQMIIEELHDPLGDLHPDLSVCLSTSGSTGSPKLVRYSDAKLAANARSIQSYLGLDETEVAMVHLPIEYSFGLSVLHSHISAGAKVLLTEHSIVQKPFWERMQSATSISGVPFHFELLLRMRLERMNLPQIRYLAQAGGHLPAPLVAQVHEIAEKRGWKFHVMYGQTEAGPRISWLQHELVCAYPGCIGQAIPGVWMSLQDGELIVESPSIMMGYAMSRKDLALGDEMEGRLATGDLAEEAGPGIFQITGRKTRFLKIQGNRVSLSDVEARLFNMGYDVHCVGNDDNLVICTAAHNPEPLRQAAVALFSFPARSINVRALTQIPRKPNGKIDYVELTLLAMEQPQ